MKKILLAVDGSLPSKHACEHVLALQGERSARFEVHLVNVQPRAPVLASAEIPGLESSWQVSHQAAGRELLGPIEDQFARAGAHCSGAVLEGEPAQAIVERAKMLGCDEIVMGTRGMTALKDLVLGSVALKVVHDATCPVTLVK